MDPALQPWLDLWDYLDGNFWHICQWVATLTPQQVGWQPVPEVASIGWNLQHLGEMLDLYLAQVFHQGPGVQHTPLLTMRAGSRDDGRYRDVSAIAAYHRQLRPAYRRFLTGLTLTDLQRVITKPGWEPFTYSWAVGHIAEHESYHLGKVTLLRRLLPA